MEGIRQNVSSEEEIEYLIRARYPLIYVTSTEEERVDVIERRLESGLVGFKSRSDGVVLGFEEADDRRTDRDRGEMEIVTKLVEDEVHHADSILIARDLAAQRNVDVGIDDGIVRSGGETIEDIQRAIGFRVRDRDLLHKGVDHDGIIAVLFLIELRRRDDTEIGLHLAHGT